MLQFFRNIRRRLLESGKVRNYALYAIGEILLVVIGILIALQINNWNEGRKDRAAELIALIDLKEEFENNQQQFKDLLRFKAAINQEWETYLATISDKDKPIEERGKQRPPVGSRNFVFANSTLNSILSSGKIDKIENDTLKHLLSSWADVKTEFDRAAEIHLNFFQNQLQPYEYQFAAFEKHVGSNIINPFYSKSEIAALNNLAIQNLSYQNLLLTNVHWLKLQLSIGEEVEKTIEQIIKLLEQEIHSKQR